VNLVIPISLISQALCELTLVSLILFLAQLKEWIHSRKEVQASPDQEPRANFDFLPTETPIAILIKLVKITRIGTFTNARLESQICGNSRLFSEL